jgi:hypothetical protein
MCRTKCKSILNLDDLFLLLDACTVGVDISNFFLPINEFGTHSAKPENPVHIGFVDVEGQGNRDVEYDAKVVCPILFISKTVIFNWKDSFQKDSILNKLGVITKGFLRTQTQTQNLKPKTQTQREGAKKKRNRQQTDTHTDAEHTDQDPKGGNRRMTRQKQDQGKQKMGGGDDKTSHAYDCRRQKAR